MGLWFGIDTTTGESLCIWLSIGMLLCVAVVAFCFVTDLYRLMPFWGAIRKFDGHGNEQQRINQFLIHEHLERLGKDPSKMVERGASGKEKKDATGYGAIGKSTWGHCEAPMQSVPFVHPEAGNVMFRVGFDETQKMRRHSSWWAKDEPTFIHEQGLHRQRPQMNQPTVNFSHSMV
mmetsp:Transcript_34763/g.92820  ORF Transcript_34763/g.92820 Transcript_34763/m.92820 type:complete len:176 (-) Transcript_34763:97-624(-)|eukprot:CAMPEP_0194484332 /NCGR_PEP_ID=MMETSP0253-20130528/5675_1 /TAXON_ID=2966 /ORGANISM="Noctiluca scintillans" /LENGTH=175 /DNA_ID=CAMNT_0039324115 /DNA_START=27 /DNA_END=554 /DNA_ORIENTATION=+